MKEESLNRASDIREELSTTKRNIATLEKQLAKIEPTSIIIREYDDSSGWNIESIFYKGGYNADLYNGILSDILQRYQTHLKLLLAELKEL